MTGKHSELGKKYITLLTYYVNTKKSFYGRKDKVEIPKDLSKMHISKIPTLIRGFGANVIVNVPLL